MVKVDVNLTSADGVKLSGGYSNGSIDVEFEISKDSAVELISDLIKQLNNVSNEQYNLEVLEKAQSYKGKCINELGNMQIEIPTRSGRIVYVAFYQPPTDKIFNLKEGKEYKFDIAEIQ